MHPAYFNEGGIQIIPPSSAVAYIEMKSSFDASTLEKAIKVISNTQLVLGENGEPTWRCVCFASIDREFNSFSETVCSKLNKIIDSLNFDNAHEVMDRLPTCIASLESYVVFIKANIADNSIVLNFFNFGKLSPSIAFCDLFECVRSHYGHSNIGELSEIILGMPNNGYLKLDVKIKSD